MSGNVRVERGEHGVVTLWLDNPAHRNALNDGMIAALTDSFRELSEDASCAVVVLRGTGGIFCAGREIGDLQGLQTAGMDAINAAYARLSALNDAAYFCPKPVVAVLQRYAMGAGIMLAGWADIALAEEDCVMSYPEVRLGIPPTITTVQLIRGVHRKAAVELLLTARKFRAQEAARLGLITRAMPADALEADVASVVEALVAASPEAITRTKQMIWNTEDANYRSAIAAGVDAISVAAATRSAHEGVSAFLAKRKPVW